MRGSSFHASNLNLNLNSLLPLAPPLPLTLPRAPPPPLSPPPSDSPSPSPSSVNPRPPLPPRQFPPAIAQARIATQSTVKRKMATLSTGERFVIGVDFGTTYPRHPPPSGPELTSPCSFTSVAFAHSASPEVVSLVKKWPGAVNNSSAYQVPTEVLYANPLWGYEITAGGRGSVRGGGGGGGGSDASTNVLKWFKLLLQERPTGSIRTQGPTPQPGSGSGSSGDSSSGLESLFGGLGVTELSSTFTPPSVTPAQRTAGMLQKANLTPVAVVTDFLKAVRETALASIEGTYGTE